MKKLFCAFLLSLLTINTYAETSKQVLDLESERTIAVLRKYIPDDTTRANVIDIIKTSCSEAKSTYGIYGLINEALKNVCDAAGWTNDKTQCKNFVRALIQSSDNNYYEACKDEYKGKTGYNCIDDVFYALVNGIDVQIGQAIELSKEYALVWHKDDIECSENTRNGTLNKFNDYVKCRSKTEPIYYEFKFDDIKQSTNTPIYKDTIRAVGNIHKVPFRDSGCSLERIMNDTACTVGYKTTDTAVCDKLSKSLGRFGMKAEVRNVTGASLNDVERFCAVSFTTNKCTAAKEYGIDDTVFKEVQYPLSPTLENYIKDYVFEQLKAKNIYPKSFSCDKIPVRGDQVVAGLHVANGYTLNCHIDDKCIGFVFEDLSESADYSKNAALSRLACIKQGGKADGENCRGLDEAQCTALGEKIKASGKLMGTHYDRVRGGCILNGAVAESQINILGEIAAGVAITLVTDGAATIPVIVSIGTDLAFDAVNDWQRKIPYNDYQEFIAHVMDCVEDKKSGLQDAIRISKVNSVENKYCLSETIKQDYQLVVGQMDKLAPEDQRILSEVFANIIDNIGDAEYIRKASESDISLVKKSRNFAQGALLAGLFFFHPEKMLSKFDDVAKDVARLRYGASKNFTQHLDDFKRGVKNSGLPINRLSKSEWQALNKSLASDGVEMFERDGLMWFRKLDSVDELAYMGRLRNWRVSNIENVKVNTRVKVYKFTEEVSGKIYYLKYTDDIDEIRRTKRAYEILEGQSDIVHTANVIEDDQKVLIDFTTKHNLPQTDGNYWFVTEEVPSSVSAYNLAEYDMSPLAGKPITLAEQEEILKSVKRLNDAGIYHGDLWSNMFFKRTPNGKLQVDIIDFEPWSAADSPHDIDDVKDMFESLAAKGGAEVKSINVITHTGNENTLFLGRLKQYTGYNFIYKSAAESGLKRGHYRLDLSNMSDSEIYAIQNKLRYTGVADKAEIINTNKGKMLVLYEDDMINLGSNMKVSGSMLDNYYGAGGKVDNLQAKVESILNTNYPNENALRQAWHDSGAWNMNEAYRLTQDLRAGVIRDIKANPDLANRIRRYNSLSLAEKDQVWIDINYIVGGQNRIHTGKTMIGFLDNSDFAISGHSRFLGAHNGNNETGHMFRYNRQELNDFDRMFSTVVHENVHGFQESGRTAINQNAWQYRMYNYSRGSTSGYTNQLNEMESRFVQEYASRGFLSELLNSL